MKGHFQLPVRFLDRHNQHHLGAFANLRI
jgi:hypothetical protein